MDLYEHEQQESSALHSNNNLSVGIEGDKQLQEIKEYEDSKNTFQIQTGLPSWFTSTNYPECVLNPKIPLIWFGCKYCSSIFQTSEERSKHKAESHRERRPKRRKLNNSENHYTSNVAVKTFLSPPLPNLTLQVSNQIVSSTTITTTSNETKKDFEKVSSPSNIIKSMKKRRVRNIEEQDDDDDSPRLPCDCCTETFSNRKDLQRHKKLHSNDHHEKSINLGTPSSNLRNNISIISRRNLERRADSSSSSSSSSQHFSDLDKNNNTSNSNNNNSNNNICPVCLKNFGFKDTLKRHLKGHKAQVELEDETDSDVIPLLNSPRRETMRKIQSISHSLHPIHLLQALKGPKTSHHIFRKSNEKKSLVPVVATKITPRRKLLVSRSQLESLSPDSVTLSTNTF